MCGPTRRRSGSSSGCRPRRWARSGSELSLRGEDGEPTEQALGQGHSTPTPLKDGTPFYMWNRQEVEELMQAYGYQRLDPQEVKARELAESWVQTH